MVGRIVWYSDYKTQGLVTVTNEHGEAQSYFLLLSKIVKRPEKIQAGNFVKFHKIIPAARQGLLPVALEVIVSEHPFTETSAGAAALAGEVRS